MAQCHAHRKTGTQCKNNAIPGGFVCRFHGGSAPQVKRKALERLNELVDPAIDEYVTLLKCEQPATVLNTVKDILDRTGHKPTERQEITNYTPEDVETLANLDDIELAAYIELRRKVTQKPAPKEPIPT